MKRGSILLIFTLMILLLAIPGVLAEKTTKITDTYYNYIDSFKHNEDVYTIRAINTFHDDPYDGTVIIKKNDIGTTVKFGECIETTEYKYCFVNRSYEGNKVDIDTNGNVQPAVRILIEEYTYENSLKITRTYEKTKFHLYETGLVTITAENTGDVPLTNIKLIEKLPNNFEFSHYQEGMAFYNNSIFNVFNLYPGNTWTSTYRIKAIDYGKEAYQTVASYNTEIEKGLDAKSKKTTIEVVKPFSITQTKFKKALDRNTDVKYSVTIKNNEDKPLTIEYLIVHVPTIHSFGNGDNIKKDGILQYRASSTVIEPGNESVYAFTDKVSTLGEYAFSYRGRIKLKDKEYYLNNESRFSIETDGLNCFINFNETEAEAGKAIEYNVTLKNNDNEVFYELKGNVSSIPSSVLFEEKNILSKEEQVVAQEKTYLPFSFDEKLYNFSVQVGYRTVDNLLLSCSSYKELAVRPVPRIVEINVNSTKTEVHPGENLTIQSFLYNPFEEQTIEGITVNHTLKPHNLQTNTKETTTQLLPLQKQEVEPFTFTVPQNFSGTEITVTTEVGITNRPNYSEQITTSVPVIQTQQRENVNSEDNQTSSPGITISKNTKPKSSSFWQEFIDMIKSVFS